MDIKIYTAAGCSYCEQVKELMERAGLEYTAYLVGTDITVEQLKNKYPLAVGYPYVIIDEKPIGGLVDTAKLFIQMGLVSSKTK